MPSTHVYCIVGGALIALRESASITLRERSWFWWEETANPEDLGSRAIFRFPEVTSASLRTPAYLIDVHDGLLPETRRHKRLKTLLVKRALVLRVVLHVLLHRLISGQE